MYHEFLLCIINTFFNIKIFVGIHGKSKKVFNCAPSSIFGVVSADLFPFVTNVYFELGAELLLNHYLVICSLRVIQPLAKTKLHHKRFRSHSVK